MCIGIYVYVFMVTGLNLFIALRYGWRFFLVSLHVYFTDLKPSEF